MAKQNTNHGKHELVDALKKSIQDSQNEYVELTKDEVKECIQYLEKSIQDSQDEYDELTKDEAKYLEEKNEGNEIEIKRKQKQPSQTEAETSSFFQKWFKKKLYLFIPNSTPLYSTFEKEFTKRMEKKSISCEVFKTKEQLKDDAPLIVVCQVSSRIRSDIEHVLKQLTLPYKFAVAVINTQREDSLPRLPIERRLKLTEDEHNNITFIDVAFTMETLMYECKMNTNAYDKIKRFVNEFKK